MVSLGPGSVRGERGEVTRRVRQAFGVGVAVLHDQAGDPLRVTQCETEADGRAEVEEVQGEPGQAQAFDEAFGDGREPVEAVLEPVGRRRVAEAGVVGRDEAVVRAQGVDQAPELV